jgi:hypothetical protein
MLDAIIGHIRAQDHAWLSKVDDLYEPTLHSVHTFRVLRQIRAFFCKNAAFTVEADATAAALEAFASGETVCRISNKRLDYYFTKRDRLDPDLSKQLSRMESSIAKLLGDPKEFLDSIPAAMRITGGASVKHGRRVSAPPLKLRRRVCVTPGSQAFVLSAAEYFGYRSIQPFVTPFNRITTVPKNWKTDRTIACEPEGTVPFQLAGDSFIKAKLKKVGR